MSFPFTKVVQHHEGSGKPRDGVELPFYSYVIGATEWHMRSDLVNPAAPKPGGDTSTQNFNRLVIGVCLTGNRQTGIPGNPAYPITDFDIWAMQEIAIDARIKGWLVNNPDVEPHKKMPGSNTECPGDLTIARWPDIVNAYQFVVPEDDIVGDRDFVASCSNANGSWKMRYDGTVETITGKFYGSYFSLPPETRNDPTRRFRTMFAHVTGGYTLVSVKGEVYSFDTVGG